MYSFVILYKIIFSSLYSIHCASACGDAMRTGAASTDSSVARVQSSCPTATSSVHMERYTAIYIKYHNSSAQEVKLVK